MTPSSTVAQGYDSYLITTKNGRTMTGMLVRQTEDLLVVRDSAGGELRLARDQIDELSRSTTSLMPEGLERAFTPAEFRDLLAFLQGLR